MDVQLHGVGPQQSPVSIEKKQDKLKRKKKRKEKRAKKTGEAGYPNTK
jgi:hypothetical protein